MKLVDIIFVNYNSTDYLLKCIESIYACAEDFKFDIWVEDNNSTDNVERVTTAFNAVHLNLNDKNLGFATAVNKAIGRSSAPYIVIINPDSIVGENFFQKVLTFMMRRPDIGILGPKILNSNGSVQGSARAYPTPVNGFFGRTSLLSRLFPNNIFTKKNFLTKKNGGTDPVDVDWVSGACMVVRRDAIHDVGGMDEQFFMYWEDVDWCKRMWQKGWKVFYFPHAFVIHHVGGSSDKRPFRSKLEFHKSCYKYFIKYPLWPGILNRSIFSIALSIRFFFLLLFDIFQINAHQTPKRFKPRLLFFITEDWYFWSHRLPIARAARDSGYEVVIVTRVHEHRERILNEGFKLIPIKLERRGKNVVKEIKYFLEIVRIYHAEKPDIVHHVAVKPVAYGSLAATVTSVPVVVNALAGLGSIFVTYRRQQRIIRRLVVMAYRFSFLPRTTVGIFQNPEDLNLFVGARVINKKKTALIRGSGVNTAHFGYCPENTSTPIVLLASRMLWDKGVGEFIEAVKILQKEHIHFRAILAGDPDPENPESIPTHILRNWHTQNIVEWLGHINDMPKILAQSNIVVLPSYREGLPKVLLEAASCGRAIVATDVPGCREIVRNNDNGILVQPFDSRSLAEAMKQLILDTELRKKMGLRGRKIVIDEFSEEIVVKKTLQVYNHFFPPPLKTSLELCKSTIQTIKPLRYFN